MSLFKHTDDCNGPCFSTSYTRVHIIESEQSYPEKYLVYFCIHPIFNRIFLFETTLMKMHYLKLLHKCVVDNL